MLSLCFNHVATVASSFRSTVFHLLGELSKICEIFLCEKIYNEIKLTEECPHIQPHKR